MQTAASSNLFLINSSSFKVLTGLQKASGQGEFYQQIVQGLIKGIHSREAVTRSGDRLIALAHHAYTLRQMDVVEQASEILMNLPLTDHYRDIGLYYHAIDLRRKGRVAEARSLVESLVDKAPPTYRGRVIMTLAGLVFEESEYKSALPLYVEAARAAYDRNWCDWFTALTTQRMLAVLKSIDGNHRGALADLENQFPLIRTVSSFYPSLYYGYLNSLAVELGEVGRLEEAQNVCQIILTSSFASAYPECRETGQEIAARRYRSPRSILHLADSKPNNLLRLPDRQHSDSSAAAKPTPASSLPSARILDYLDWKKKMVKEPNNQDDEQLPTDLDQMTDKDMIVKIFQLSSQEDLTREQLRDILEHVLKVTNRGK